MDHSHQTWSRFSLWQIFQTPAGVAKTNNPIESFYKQIKSVYTNYELHSIHQFMLIVLQKLINQYSYKPKDFCFFRSPCQETIKKANEICNEELSLIKNSENSFWYKNIYLLYISDHSNYINYKYVSCSCVFFHKNIVCKHTMTLAIVQAIKSKNCFGQRRSDLMTFEFLLFEKK